MALYPFAAEDPTETEAPPDPIASPVAGRRIKRQPAKPASKLNTPEARRIKAKRPQLDTPESRQEFLVNEADRQGVNPALAGAIGLAESGRSLNPKARSPKGARGPMQLMPGTAKSLGVNPDDAAQNMIGGVAYLKQQQDTFGADRPDLIAAAYNAGPGAVQRHRGVPPYKETQAYKEKVLRTMTALQPQVDQYLKLRIRRNGNGETDQRRDGPDATNPSSRGPSNPSALATGEETRDNVPQARTGDARLTAQPPDPSLLQPIAPRELQNPSTSPIKAAALESEAANVQANAPGPIQGAQGSGVQALPLPGTRISRQPAVVPTPTGDITLSPEEQADIADRATRFGVPVEEALKVALNEKKAKGALAPVTPQGPVVHDETLDEAKERIAKKHVDVVLTGMHQKESPVILPGYHEKVEDLKSEVDNYNERAKAERHVIKPVPQAAQPAQGVQTVGSGTGETEAVAPHPPTGGGTPMEKVLRDGGVATFPVDRIEGLRRRGVPDGQILKEIQDDVARQAGMKLEDVAFLTQKYGRHPFSNMVEPGTDNATTLDKIIEQGRSGEVDFRPGTAIQPRTGGMAKFHILPEVMRSIAAEKSMLDPSAVMTEEAKAKTPSVGIQESLHEIASGKDIGPGSFEARAVANLLLKNPEAVRLISAAASGGLEHAAETAQTLQNAAHFVGKGTLAGALSEGTLASLTDKLVDMAQNTARTSGDDVPATALRFGTKTLMSLLRMVATAEAGGMAFEGVEAGPLVFEGLGESAHIGSSLALGLEAGVGQAHKGLGAAVTSGVVAGAVYGAIFSEAFGAAKGAIGEELPGLIGLTPKITPAMHEAILAGTKSEAIDAAAKVFAKALTAKLVGMTAAEAFQQGAFIATTYATQAIATGKKPTTEDLIAIGLQGIALGILPRIGELAEIPGKIREMRTIAEGLEFKGTPREPASEGQRAIEGRVEEPTRPTGEPEPVDVEFTPKPKEPKPGGAAEPVSTAEAKAIDTEFTPAPVKPTAISTRPLSEELALSGDELGSAVIRRTNERYSAAGAESERTGIEDADFKTALSNIINDKPALRKWLNEGERSDEAETQARQALKELDELRLESEPLKPKLKEGGKSDATQTGIEQGDEGIQLQGTRTGRDIPTYEGEVRGKESQPAAGGDRALGSTEETRGTPDQTGEEVAPTKRKFSSTQVDLPEPIANKVRALAQTIPDEDLAEDGREDSPHITVKYGLHGDDAEEVRKALAAEGPIKVTLGKTSIFPAKETGIQRGGDQYDVVKADVDSPDLHRLNKAIADALPHTDTHPEYQPHVTLAYVKPGLGQKYAGRTNLEGQEITLDKIAFTDREGNVTEIPLKGAGTDVRTEEVSGTAEPTERPAVSAEPIQSAAVGDYQPGDILTHPRFASGAALKVEAVDEKTGMLTVRRADGKGKALTIDPKSKIGGELHKRVSAPKPKVPDAEVASRVNQAVAAGLTAFKSGLPATPARDPALAKLLEGLEVGQGKFILDAWSKAWHKANAEAPVSGVTDAETLAEAKAKEAAPPEKTEKERLAESTKAAIEKRRAARAAKKEEAETPARQPDAMVADEVKRLADTVKVGDEFLEHGRNQIVTRVDATGLELRYASASKAHRAISFERLVDQLASGEMRSSGKLEITPLRDLKKAPKEKRSLLTSGPPPGGWEESDKVPGHLRKDWARKQVEEEREVEEGPKVTWKKAAIVPTREGVKAIPIKEPAEERKRLAQQVRDALKKSRESQMESVGKDVAETSTEAETAPARTRWNEKDKALQLNKAAARTLAQIRGKASLKGLALSSSKARLLADKADEMAGTHPENSVEQKNLQALRKALLEAASSSEEFAIHLAGDEETRSHELFHVAQLALERFFQYSPAEVAVKALPNFDRARSVLLEKPYGHIADNPRAIAHEISAHIVSGAWEEVGLTVDQGVDFVDGYFRLIAKTYKPDALKRFDQVNGAFGRLRDAILEEIGSEGSAAEATTGGVSGMGEGRQGSSAQIYDQEQGRAGLQTGQAERIAGPSVERFLKNSTVKHVVFHATDQDFNEFAFTEDIGFHFGTESHANHRARELEDVGKEEGGGPNTNIIPAYIRVKNPLRLDDLITWKPFEVLDALVDQEVITSEQAETVPQVDRETVRDLLAAKGYDGIVYTNEHEAGEKREDSYIVFDPNQIKSATGNRGSFNAKSWNMLESLGKIPLPPEVVQALQSIAKSFVEEGRTDFDELVGEFEDLLGEEAFDEVADYLPEIVASQAKGATIPAEEASPGVQPTEPTAESRPGLPPSEIRGARQAAAEPMGAVGQEALGGELPAPIQRTEAGEPVEPSGGDSTGERAGSVLEPGGAGERPTGREGAGDEGVHPAAGGKPGGGPGTQPGSGRGQRGDTGLRSEQLVDEDRSPEEKRDDETRAKTKSLASDFIATEASQIGAGGMKTKYKNNILAIKTLRQIESEGRTIATPQEQEILARFVGWGMFPQLFKDFGEWEDPRLKQIKNWDERREQREEAKEEKEKWQAEAEEFRALMTDEEYNSAERSILNAHYTHPLAVQGMWSMAERMGFKGGRVLEPALGVGNFFAMMPAELRGKSKLNGVELDLITGAMAKLLYPSMNIQIKGYQDIKVPDDFYDLAISNVPFGDYHVYDRDYEKIAPRSSIHDYFFLKTVDKVRPGGLTLFITSSFSMDKGDSRIRELIAKKADLVQAIRLPDGAFEKNAGTAVVTDIIILRGRAPGEAPSGPAWMGLGKVPDPDGGADIPINEYYVANPQNVLGAVDRKSRMYGKGHPHVSVTPDLWTRLLDAIMRTPEGIYSASAKKSGRTFEPQRIEAPGELKDGNLTVKDGKLWQKQGDHLAEQKPPARMPNEKVDSYKKRLADLNARVQGMSSIRDNVRAVFKSQIEGGTDDERETARRDLNKTYDQFVKTHGYISEAKNNRAFALDPDWPTLLALEDWNPKTKKAKKRAIFKQDVITHAASPDKATDVTHALSVTLAESGDLDLERMSELLDTPAENITPELVEKELAFNDPKTGWVPAAEYLSGNVRRKLYEAREAALADEQYKPNVDALEKVQPEDVGYDKIYVRLGAPWLQPVDIQEFAAYLMSGKASDFQVGYIESSGQWLAHYTEKGKDKHQGSSASIQLYGTEEAPFMTVLQNALDGRIIRIMGGVDEEGEGMYRESEDGKRQIPLYNPYQSGLANGKITEIREKFANWIWTDEERRIRLHRFYNDTFNNVRAMTFDGSHLTIDDEKSVLRGMNPGIHLRTHQVDAVWRMVAKGRVLFNHEVGTGKTYTMIAAAMELRRMGLSKKPAIAALKANVEDITAAARNLYPGIKVKSIEGQFSQKDRRRTISMVATGDYDLVILTHDNLNQLPMNGENEARFIQEELEELKTVLHAAEEADAEAGAGESSGYGRRSKKQQESRLVKQLRKQQERLKAKLKKAIDRVNKDTNVTFEETGIDALFVDEAHMYKSLPIYTRLERIKGIPTNYSQRAANMLMRTRWLLEQNGGRGIAFATGTPVANTIAELFNVQRYLQWNDLVERGIQSFDAWAKNYTIESTKMTMHFTGDYAPETRLDEFINVPDLQQLTQQIIDTKQTEDLPQIVRPKREDHAHTLPMSRQQRAYMMTLRARMEIIKARKRPPEKGDDIPLTVNTDARKMSVDIRMVMPNGKDYPDSKVNRVVKNVIETLKAHPGTTQLIFSDIGVRANSWGFRLYDDIIEKLVKAGIPRNKIIDFAKFANSDAGKAAKAGAQERLRTGDATIGIGSTQKLGTGVNVQDKLITIHHLDSQYVPANVEQRNGRIWRQGNQHEAINIDTYVTAGSIDARLWSIVGRKSSMIKQFLKGDATSRTFKAEAGDELSPEVIAAIASGNSLLVEKIQLEEDLKNLAAAEKRHVSQQYAYQDTAAKLRRELKKFEDQLQMSQADKETYDKHAGEAFSLTVKKMTVTDPGTYREAKHVQDSVETDKVEAAQALQKAFDAVGKNMERSYKDLPVGEYKGFTILRQSGNDGTKILKGEDTYTFNMAWKDVPALDEKGAQIIEQRPGKEKRAEWARMEKAPDDPGSWVRGGGERIPFTSLTETSRGKEDDGVWWVHYTYPKPKFKTVLDEELTIQRLEDALSGWNGIKSRLDKAQKFLDTESVGVKKIEEEIGKPFKDQAALDSLRERVADLTRRVAAGEGQEGVEETGPVYIGDKVTYADQTWVVMDTGKYPMAISMTSGDEHQWNSQEEFESQTGRKLGQGDEEEGPIALHSLDDSRIEEGIVLGEGDEGEDEEGGTEAGMPSLPSEAHHSTLQPRTEEGKFNGPPPPPPNIPPDPMLADDDDEESDSLEAIEAHAFGNMVQLQTSKPPEPDYEKGKVSSGDVIKSYIKIFDKLERPTPVRVGRISQRSAAGIYKSGPEVIRLRTANDIPTAAHEVGHGLQNFLYGSVKSSALKTLPPAVKRELVALGKACYGTTKPAAGYSAEGFGEFMRYYLTSDDTATAAPTMLHYFENTVLPNNEGVREALTEARRLTDIYRREGGLARAKADMPGAPSLKERVGKALRSMSNLPTELIEAFTPLMKLAKEAEELMGARLAPGKNPYEVASALRGSASGKVHYMLFHGMIDYAGNHVGAPLVDAAAMVKDQRAEFTAYLWAMRALERWGQGKNPGMTREDATYLATNLGSHEFTMAAQKVYDWNNGILNYVEQMVPSLGPAIEKIRENSYNYVPLARVFEEPSGSLLRQIRTTSGGDPLKRMYGSGRMVQDIFPQMIANAEKLVSMAHKRKVLELAMKFSELPGAGNFVEEVPIAKVRHSVEIEAIAHQLELAGADLSNVNLDDIVTMFTPAMFPKGQDPIIPMMKDGQMHWYQVNRELYDTLEGMDLYKMGPVANLLIGVPNRLFRLGTTGLRAAFSMITNPQRDFQTFMLQTASHKNPAALFGAYLHGMLEAVTGSLGGKHSPYYDLFLRLSGPISQPLGGDVALTRRPAKELFQGKIIRGVTHPVELLRELLSLTESGPRIGELIALKDEVGWDGTSPITFDQMIQLALGARRVTVDFNAAGRTGRKLNQWIPFYNASSQGPRQFFRQMRDRPLRTMFYGMGLLTLSSLYLWWKNKDKKWYRDMPDREKYLYWNIEVNPKVIIQTPRAFEYGNFFSVVPEAIANTWYTKDPDGVKAAIGHIFTTTNPLDLPVLGRVAKEQWQNRIDFFDRPIVPRGEQDLTPGEQRGPYTSKLADWLGDIYPEKISPRRVDSIIRSIGGGAAPDLMDIVGIGSPRSSREKEAADLPVVGRMFRRGGEMGPGGSKAIEKFYDEYAKVQQRAASKVQVKENAAERARRIAMEDANKALKVFRQLSLVTPGLKERQQLHALSVEIANAATKIDMSVPARERP